MNTYKLSKFKWLYLFSIVLLLLLVYWEAIWQWFTFDPNASDLSSFDGMEIKGMIFFSHFRTDIGMFNLGFYTSFFFPILLVVLAYDYLSLKNKYFKMFIGKNDRYNSELLKSKVKLALIPFAIYSIVYIVIVVLSVAFNNFNIDEFKVDILIADGSFLNEIVNTPTLYLIFYWFITALGIFINALFLFKIGDVLNNYVRCSLAYLFFIWLFSVVIYRFCPFYFAPLTTIMITSYNQLELYQIILPYLSIAIIYIILKRNPYEI